MPNAENCTLSELETAADAAVSKRSHIRLMAMKALLLGFVYDQVAALYSVSRRTLSRWVERFNRLGIDGLIESPRNGRPSKISPEQSAQYEELIEHPERVNYTHWTAKKFHGYLTKELNQEIGYRTVARWLHQQDFRLKVPRPWPNGQNEEKRKAFVELINAYLADPEIDLWYLDETGIEGDPRPRQPLGYGDHRNCTVRTQIFLSFSATSQGMIRRYICSKNIALSLFFIAQCGRLLT